MLLYVNSRLEEGSKKRLRDQVPADIQIAFRQDLAEGEQAEVFAQADFLMGNAPADWLKSPNKLQWWQLDSAGFDAYKDIELSIPVTNMGDFFAWPCAETIVGGVLAFYRTLDELAVLQTQSKWVGAALRPSMFLLRKKSVIILGSGAIGQVIKQILTGFECSIRFLARTNPDAELHTVEELKEALPDTDIVFNTLPGSAKGFFSAELIKAMKPGSVFANVGRGTTVDEAALIENLQSGHLGGAVLDVTEKEPLPADSPLWTMPNVILTQHTGGGIATEELGKIDLFLENLRRFQEKEPLQNEVKLERGY
ncbi:D-2-hydroxyacid dehydrogenase [Tellurirhabdus bombi]|uniref:D-2-hydroxyacid dehydrogenase n=1 Tax=Tellurirhabdus bombi TaxID=2907205 RepID=UPI001F239D47|nr:D-2-hydroxyacid dehydrogenase [Tellurirhabdus bombi]